MTGIGALSEPQGEMRRVPGDSSGSKAGVWAKKIVEPSPVLKGTEVYRPVSSWTPVGRVIARWAFCGGPVTAGPRRALRTVS